MAMPSARLYRKIERTAAQMQGKGWGAATMRAEVACCLDMLGRSPHVFVDIGANRGDYTREVLGRCGGVECHLFEPSPHNLALLEQAFGGRDHVTINSAALSDRAETAVLYFDEPGSGLASLSQRDLSFQGVKMDLEEVVQVERFDVYWSAQGGGDIDYVKIDVEGHELAVLRGFGDQLGRAQLIQFEFGGTNLDTRTYFKDFWQLFAEHGFSLYRLSPFGPIAIDAYDVELESYVCTNYIALNTTGRSGV